MKNEITPTVLKESYRLSHAQKRMWILNHFERVRGTNNTVFGIYIEGVLNYNILDQTIFALVKRHESLRTIFNTADAEPRQYILDTNQISSVSMFTDIEPSGDPGLIISQIIKNEEKFIFDLCRFPLFRCHLIKVDTQKHICIFNMHRIIGDGRSGHLLIKDFCRFYEFGLLGKNLEDEPLKIQMKDYAEWQAQPEFRNRFKQQEAYWLNQLDNSISVLPLPVDHVSSEIRSFEVDRVRFTIDLRQTNELKKIAQEGEATLYTLLLASYNIFLTKLCNLEDIAVGIIVAGRKYEGLESLVGLLEHTLVIRTAPTQDLKFSSFLGDVKRTLIEAFAHQDYPYEELINKLLVQSARRPSPVVNTMFAFENSVQFIRNLGDLTITSYPCDLRNAWCDLFFKAFQTEDGLVIDFEYTTTLFDRSTVEKFVSFFKNVLSAIIAEPDVKISGIEIINDVEKDLYQSLFTSSKKNYSSKATLVSLFEEQVRIRPDRIAVVDNGKGLTYNELNERSNLLAHNLREKHQIKPGDVIAVIGQMSAKLVTGLLGILKAGAAFVPIHTALTKEKILFILNDSEASVLLITGTTPEDFKCNLDVLHIDGIENSSTENLYDPNTPNDLCYLAYTQEPIEKLKAVMVSHSNLVSLFLGMNEKIAIHDDSCLLALPEIEDSTAVFQVLWPLLNGIVVVIHQSCASLSNLNRYVSEEDLSVDFSLFFFANYDVKADDKYRLLLEAVKYADQEGFKAVWTPERHFHEFGGLFPNPSVTSAALAMITSRLSLRSGSVVSPLHDAIRIAEEWSVVDNLSRGRVELSFASGWNINDFALSKDNYQERHKIMYEQIEVVQRLWRGEAIKRENGLGKTIEVHTFPVPIQKELPIWITAAGNDETFIKAGEKGSNILTHLLGQDMEELSRKIKLYRQARERCGFDERMGKVAVMLHTYIGDEISDVEKIVEQPFIEYLKSAIGLSKILYEEAGLKEQDIPEADKEIMLRHSFKRYYKTAALIGTRNSCAEMIKKLKGIGVDEIACLVDFGIEKSKVIEGLKNLKALKDLFANHMPRIHQPVTMMQTTPLKAERIGVELGSDLFLNSLQFLLLKGESVPGSYLCRLKGNNQVQIFNIFGYEEATIVTSLNRAKESVENLSSGNCLGNSHPYILNKALQFVSVGVEGDLYIGGEGISLGYWKRPELTKAKFLSNPFKEGGKLFKTGDTAKWLPDGSIEVIKKAALKEGSCKMEECVQTKDYAFPSTEAEEKLIALWSNLLSVAKRNISLKSSFFELGGHSLSAIQLINEIQKEFSITLDLGKIYENSCISQLSELLEQMGVNRIQLIPQAQTKEYYPTSFAQERLYNQQISNAYDPANHAFGVYRIKGEYDINKLKHSFQLLMNRHDVLRTGFSLSGNILLQRISEDVDFEFLILDVHAYRTVMQAITDFIKPFDLSSPSLMRCGLLQDDIGDLLLVDISSIVCDTYSLHILMCDLENIYAGNELLPLDRRYVDYACWQRDPNNVLEKQKEFWTKKLSGELQRIDLPIIQSRKSIGGYHVERKVLKINCELYQRNKKLGTDSNASDFIVLLSVYFILLSKVTGQANVMIGTEVTGRPQRALKNLVGVFAKILPLKIQVASQVTYSEFLCEVQNSFRQAVANEEFPYDQIFTSFNSSEKKEIADVYFSFPQYAGKETALSDLELVPMKIELQNISSNYELGLEIYEGEGEMEINFVYCNELYDSKTIELFREYYYNILMTVLENPLIDIGNIELEHSLSTI